MSQDPHDSAMERFDEARLLELRGAPEAARAHYDAAALIEQRCADAAGDDQPRTKGILRVGAVSLWMQAGRLDQAEQLARRYLSEPLLPGFHRELHELLNEIRRRQEELLTVPVEPDERAAEVEEALREAEANVTIGKVWLRPLRVHAA